MNKKYNVAVVGATGLVGRTMTQVLEERNFPVNELTLFATSRSAGTEIYFRGKSLKVIDIEKTDFKGIDIALFSAGKTASIKYAPVAKAAGCVVIDNGSFFRMHEDVPLVVPEVNPEKIQDHNYIIANPNCSTIQLVVALKPIHDKFGLKRVIVSTYQSISGAGQKGIDKLSRELFNNEELTKTNEHPIAYNTIFHEITDDSGFSVEEIKMKQETRKILNLPDLPVSVTCVRLPFLYGHGESVNIETEKPITVESLRECLSGFNGIKVIDNPKEEKYPTVLMTKDSDEVFVGRIRLDDSVQNGAHLWVVANNIRKGAASNAVQIAEALIKSV